jgi:DNA polymerase-3 subunit gamma/tau
MAKRKPAAVAAPESPAAEGYTVLARRYRPQLFGDLVGQEPVAQALTNALESGRVAHAYLFTGARGVGKTSTARILAKALNCEKGPTPTPCNVCEICRSIAGGDDVDVLEIDGASNRGIDEVREIRNNVQFRPSRARFKIYIIDEVHMLTPAAFNALLKTLEEPPPHVKFIFATTEAQKIPITILSRCQRFDFAGIGSARIVEHLRQIVAAEGMQADDEALALVARRAAGSMRDAQSLLDQLLAFGEQRLTVQQVHQLLGTANEDRVVALASAVLERDPKRTLQLLGQAADEGMQLGEFLDQLIDYWRDLMVVNSAGPEGQTLSVSGKHAEALAGQAAGLPLDTILAGLDILVSAKARARGTNHGRVLLETALLRIGRLDDLVSLSQLVQLLGQAQGAPPAHAAAAPRPAHGAPRPAAPAEGGKKKDANGPDPAAPPAPAALTPESLPHVWQQVLAQLGPFFANDLKKADFPAISGPNTLALRFAARYNRERERCQDPAQLRQVEAALSRATGSPWSIRVDSGPTTDASAFSGPPAPETETAQARSRRHHQEVMAASPLLKRAQDILGAQLHSMDEGFQAAPLGGAPGADRPDSEES